MLFKKFFIYLRVINKGKKISHKFIIFLQIFLFLLLPYYRFNIEWFNKIRQKISLLLAKKTIIAMDQIEFNIVDSYDLRRFENYEPWMKNYLIPEKGDVFVDVGSHIGIYALQIARILNDNGLVISFEPHPINFNVLCENIKRNKLCNVISLNIAAWNKNCDVNLFQAIQSGSHSLKSSLIKGKYANSNKMPLKVKARRLDDVFEEIGVKIDWIKIDAEGSEIEILEGLEKTLKNDKPRLIIECSYKNQLDLKKVIIEHGFEIHQINDSNFYCYYLAED